MTMKLLSALALAFALGLAGFTATAADPATPAKPAPQKYRVVIQVSDPDPRLWAQAINNSENLEEILGKANVEVEIVALGQGIGMIKLDSPQANRVSDALKRGVKIVACEATMKRQKLSRDDMLPAIGYTPGGLIRIIDLQREGWSYIKG
jgi:intracellular sulfur oxidation DsrE/DsrF family protein